MTGDGLPIDDPAAVVAAMHARDAAARALGIRVVATALGSATLTMVVEAHMTNGFGTAQGGYIFAFADTAFAYACNSHGEPAVAAHCSISFLRPGKVGSTLTAVATEVFRGGRSGIYDVRVASGEGIIAEFRGHSRLVGASTRTR